MWRRVISPASLALRCARAPAWRTSNIAVRHMRDTSAPEYPGSQFGREEHGPDHDPPEMYKTKADLPDVEWVHDPDQSNFDPRWYYHGGRFTMCFAAFWITWFFLDGGWKAITIGHWEFIFKFAKEDREKAKAAALESSASQD